MLARKSDEILIFLLISGKLRSKFHYANIEVGITVNIAGIM